MNRSIYIEDIKTYEEFTGRKHFTVKLKSGFIGQGSSLVKAFDNAKYVERSFLHDLMDKYNGEILITVKCDDEKTPYIEIKGNTEDTKDLNIKNISYSYFTGLEGMVVDFERVATNRILKEKNIAKIKSHVETLNLVYGAHFNVKVSGSKNTVFIQKLYRNKDFEVNHECVSDTLYKIERYIRESAFKSGGKYAKELEMYLNKFPDVKMFEVVDNGKNVKCTLKDGRSAKSRKHPDDEFNIDLGCLWAYINANNVNPDFKSTKDILKFLGFEPDRNNSVLLY